VKESGTTPPREAFVGGRRNRLCGRDGLLDVSRFKELPLGVAVRAQTPARQSAISSMRTERAFACARLEARSCA